MKKKLIILLLVLALCLMPTANAANCSPSVHATLALQNNAAHIRAEISAPGQAIEATVVFQQEENCRVVRQYSGWSELTISELCDIVPAQTCTVVITGTIDGQAFEPVQLRQSS